MPFVVFTFVVFTFVIVPLVIMTLVGNRARIRLAIDRHLQASLGSILSAQCITQGIINQFELRRGTT